MEPRSSPYREVWVESPDGKSLVALINGELGWLMYLRYDGDGGFSSRNPDYEGPSDEVVEYRLDNGQHDFYPRAWAYPTAVIEEALDYFRTHNERPPFISWYNDSDDGTAVGDADNHALQRTGRAERS